VKTIFFAGICFLLTLAEAIGATVTSIEPRFVLLIDTSASMGRKQVTTLRTVRALVRGGFNGQIKAGDRFAIWTIGESLHPDFFPVQQWNDKDGKLLAEVTSQAIETEPHSGRGNAAIYQRVLEALPSTNALTVVFITDQTLKGSLFDSELGRYYAAHSSQILRERKAFVTSLSFENARAASFTVSITGDAPELPPAPFLAEEIETPAAETDLKVNLEPVSLSKNEPKPAPIPEVREKVAEATVPRIQDKVASAEVAEKPRTPVVPPEVQSIAPLPRNNTETGPDVPSYALPVPRERPREQVIASRPAATIAQSTTTPVVEEKRPEPKGMITNAEPVVTVPAAQNEKPAPSGSFFGFANIAYLAGAFAILGWIAWRIFYRSAARDNRSLISRSMDSRR
jgi:hypothetical protein